MIEITRSLARQLKTIFRRAITESGRGTVNQPVLLHAGPDGLRIRIASHDVAAEYHDPSPRDPDAAYIPFDLLKDCEAKNNDVVQVEMAANDWLLATWNDHHVPQMKQYDRAGVHSAVAIEHLAAVSFGFQTPLHRRYTVSAQQEYVCWKDGAFCTPDDRTLGERGSISREPGKGRTIQLLLSRDQIPDLD